MPQANVQQTMCKYSPLLPERSDAHTPQKVTISLLLGFETRLITEPKKEVLENSSSWTKFY